MSTTSTDREAAAIAAGKPSTSAMAQQRLADAVKLIDDKNFTQGMAALQAVIEANTFGSLSPDDQYRALSIAGKAAIAHGIPKRGYDYLIRALAMPQADLADRIIQLNAANKLGYNADAVSGLTSLAERWPERVNTLNPYFIVNVLRKAMQLPGGSALPPLRALYNAHWKLKWGVEPSGIWRDFALRLLEDGHLAEAIDVSARVTDVYDLIDMRVDRRFDAVVAANPARFDIDLAANRELRELQAASDNAPRSLSLKLNVIDALRHRQRYAAALAAADSLLLELRSTNYPEKLFEDYDENNNWFLNARADALERMGRWEEAAAQMSAAGLLPEDKAGNVSQLINLANLYCKMGLPKQALAALGRMAAHPSPYGAMQMEQVRLDAAIQLEDAKEAARSLQYLREHRADDPAAYQYAATIANQLDLAAQILIARLLDPEQRARRRSQASKITHSRRRLPGMRTCAPDGAP
jgi:hypothetical protein